jgi:hypothetical protein
MQWIASLLGLTQTERSRETHLPCVLLLAEDGVRIEVLEQTLPCGHTAYLIKGEYYVNERGEWLPIAYLREFNAETATKLLAQASKFVASLNAT